MSILFRESVEQGRPQKGCDLLTDLPKPPLGGEWLHILVMVSEYVGLQKFG